MNQPSENNIPEPKEHHSGAAPASASPSRLHTEGLGAQQQLNWAQREEHIRQQMEQSPQL